MPLEKSDTRSIIHSILVTCRTRRDSRMGKGMRGLSPTEMLANNGTIANIETEAISASIC